MQKFVYSVAFGAVPARVTSCRLQSIPRPRVRRFGGEYSGSYFGAERGLKRRLLGRPGAILKDSHGYICYYEQYVSCTPQQDAR